jgi:hypothetical protein
MLGAAVVLEVQQVDGLMGRLVVLVERLKEH